RLGPGGDPNLPLLGAHRRSPMGGPVNEQPVPEGHPTEPKLPPSSQRPAPSRADQRSTSTASSAKNLAPNPRSSTGTRSSAPWISGVASKRSNARAGRNPYAMQSGKAARNQRESVKPGRPVGATAAPGSSRSTKSRMKSMSGDSGED